MFLKNRKKIRNNPHLPTLGICFILYYVDNVGIDLALIHQLKFYKFNFATRASPYSPLSSCTALSLNINACSEPVHTVLSRVAQLSV